MIRIATNFSETYGKVKPMHSVNNGPVYKFASDQRITNIDSYRAAGIPFARTHDASFYSTYGGEHCVDVNNIFTNFDADPFDPASYDFVLTDEYLKVIEFSETKVFYRLGSKIEHWKKKYNTLPPKDFHKWAVVCEHIIRHYTEGWAEGFNMDIEYWEIWNEADLDPDDSDHKRCWGGTKAQFFDFYEIAAKHLKSCFPHLKIGGPAVAGNMQWGMDFLNEMKKRNVPIDFFSWHKYSCSIQIMQKVIRQWKEITQVCGYGNAESILNEWNYVKGWIGDEWLYTLRMEKDLKGSAFIACTQLMSQYEPLDHLMYYDARPCGMNGMFSTDFVCDCLKGYYPFYMFNKLYTLGTSVPVVSDEPEESRDIWAAAAKGEKGYALMLSYFNDNDSSPEKQVKLDFSSVKSEKGVKLSFYCLDREKDCELVREEIFSAEAFTAYIDMTLFSTYLVEITAV